MIQSYQPLHHKYRPERFDALVGQEAIKETLKQALTSQRIAPAYLFSGPRGTGKTSSARILAKSLNCLSNPIPTTEPCGECELCKGISLGSSLDVIEIDAASNTGVDNIRELIERSRFAPVQARWKVYVIDECHMLSTAAFNALLKTLEEPPKNVVFVLATTDPQRVLPTILSRCQRFNFRRIALTDLINHLKIISVKEKISINAEALELIAERAQGGLRDAESMLDQLSLLPQPIESDSVWDLLGAVPEKELTSLASALAKGEPTFLLEVCRNLLDSGRDPLAILQGLASVLRDLILIKSSPNKPELSSFPKYLFKDLVEISEEIDFKKLFQWQDQLKGTELQIRQSFQPRLWLEVIVLSLLAEKERFTKSTNNKSKENSDSLKKSIEISNSKKIILNNAKPNEANSFDGNKSNQIKQYKSDVNLSELWERILGNLELPSTRMLLSQQAKLIRISEDKAIVEVSTNWIGMVQSRITLLEDSIQKTLGVSKKIIIKSESDPSNANLNITNRKTEIKKESPSFSINHPDKISTQDKSNENQKNNGKVNNLSAQEEEDNKKSSSSKVEVIDSKAQQLADFFNGKIVDLDQ